MGLGDESHRQGPKSERPRVSGAKHPEIYQIFLREIYENF